MTKIKILFFFLIFIFSGFSGAFAITDPLSVPNNRIGVHILDPGEISDAAKLVNSSGGKWGYVTVPIRSDDRNREKWTAFFKECSRLQIIPLIRLATYVDGDHWVAPKATDLVDFANFLNDMPWPVKNRYVIIFNEPNHAKEWGNEVSPGDYTSILNDARDIFLSRSPDFFLISAGLDMSAPTNQTSLDALRFYKTMTNANPSWYRAIDGLGVHAYPNPGFVSSPWSKSRFGITSYQYEVKYLKSLGFSSKPVFITETGYLGQEDFYTVSLNKIWLDKNIVAITPFVLFAGDGDFIQFSLLDLSHQPKKTYLSIQKLPKIQGSPLLNDIIAPLPVNSSDFVSASVSAASKPDIITRLKNILFPPQPSLLIGQNTVKVEIVRSAEDQSRGLSNRSFLPSGSGMLFIFDKPQIRSFWMKDMLFPLDFIWINDLQVVQIDENVQPPENKFAPPSVINSRQPVDWVLEVNAGFAAVNSVKVGDRVVLNSP